MNSINFEKSFYKTQEMLKESYKICDIYKKTYEMLRYELLQVINYVSENDFTKKVKNTLKETEEIIENSVQQPLSVSADATLKSPKIICTCRDGSIDERIWCPIHDA